MKRLTEMSVDQPQKSQGISIFCQDNKDEALQWPTGTKRSAKDPLKSYVKAASAIPEFDKIGSLPMPLDGALLYEGKGIASTLVYNQAKWLAEIGSVN